jgi:hypothetical protein
MKQHEEKKCEPGYSQVIHSSIVHARMNIRAVHRGVAAGTPASSLAQIGRVRGVADVNLTSGGPGCLCLRMAPQAQVGIACDQQLAVNGAVRIVTHRTAFAQRFVLEDKRPRLFAMTSGTVFVEPRHRKTARGFNNVAAMRVVALNAIHPALDHGMALGQVELSVRLQMALKTRGCIFSGIYDEFAASTARLDMFAAWSVTRFATGLPRQLRICNMDARVWACRKHPADVRMTVVTRFVAHIICAGDFGRCENGAGEAGTGTDRNQRATGDYVSRNQHPKHAPVPPWRESVAAHSRFRACERHGPESNSSRSRFKGVRPKPPLIRIWLVLRQTPWTLRLRRSHAQRFCPKMEFPKSNAEPPGGRADGAIAG